MEWSNEDLTAFAARGWSRLDADKQMEQLQRGHRNRTVDGACTLDSGVVKWTEFDRRDRSAYGHAQLAAGRQVAGFVPASGAATRMFKDLHPPMDAAVEARLERSWRQLPFAAQLDEQRGDLAGQIIARLAHLPKGEVPFFQLSDELAQTAFEAHKAEWEALGGGELVFTVPPAFRDELPERYRVWSAVRWDVQEPGTDTLAWDAGAGSAARDAEGGLRFRPGGHGALLENLARISAPAAVLRNIDNAVPPSKYGERTAWRTALLGALWHLEDERVALWQRLQRNAAGCDEAAWAWLSRFVRGADRPETLEQWQYHLDRPIRVAGVVPNAGQAGGGPFWVADADGFFRPGIAEAAELSAGMVAEGTHFNPVDLAVSFLGLDGQRLDIRQFTDEGAFFTAEKVVEGQTLRILERPGLWNGSMSGWLTQFVELPASVFAPVKSFFDLCR